MRREIKSLEVGYLLRLLMACVVGTTLYTLTACTDTLNNPHPPHSELTNTLFVPFSGRSPKYLDPASSYSNDETPAANSAP